MQTHQITDAATVERLLDFHQLKPKLVLERGADVRVMVLAMPKGNLFLGIHYSPKRTGLRMFSIRDCGMKEAIQFIEGLEPFADTFHSEFEAISNPHN